MNLAKILRTTGGLTEIACLGVDLFSQCLCEVVIKTYLSMGDSVQFMLYKKLNWFLITRITIGRNLIELQSDCKLHIRICFKYL